MRETYNGDSCELLDARRQYLQCRRVPVTPETDTKRHQHVLRNSFVSPLHHAVKGQILRCEIFCLGKV
jgi:methionine-rich copper-binding protein CopC